MPKNNSKLISNILILTGSSLSIDQHSGVANPTVWSMPKVGGAYPEMGHVPGARSAGTLERSTSAMSGRIAVPLLQASPSLKRPASSAGVCLTSPELTERRQVRYGCCATLFL